MGARLPALSSDYAGFAATFGASLAHNPLDIVIAPLSDNFFNRCKSSIKFLEYSACRLPGVYSRLDPYSGVVIHGENGFLAGTLEEWEKCLVELIENPELRWEMGQKALETIHKDWLIESHAGDWLEVYRRVQSFVSTAGVASSARRDSPVYRAAMLAQRWQKQADIAAAGVKEPDGSRGKDLAMTELSRQLDEKEQVLVSLRQAQASLDEKDLKLQSISAELVAIKNSRAYALVKWIWKIRSGSAAF